jgi:hypothetical protein
VRDEIEAAGRLVSEASLRNPRRARSMTRRRRPPAWDQRSFVLRFVKPK